MPTTSLAGDRSRRARNPRDTTGIRYAQQHAEHDATKAAEKLDINEVRRTEYLRGHSEGVTYGFTEGWNALGNLLIESGAITEERLLEIVNTADEDRAE
jgi:hypothetical protein